MAMHWWKLGLGAGVLIGGAGCAPSHGAHAAKEKPLDRGSLLHPATWPEAPLGNSVALHTETQIANAMAGRMVLHDYDFVPGTAELNDRGRDRVLQIAALLPHNRFPVVVERLPRAPELAEGRRLTVLNALAVSAGRVPPERVVGGPSPSYPLQGPEAERVYFNLLQLTESAGTVPATGVRDGATTGFVGGTGTGGGSGTNGTGGGR
jgi:hypothetical protein